MQTTIDVLGPWQSPIELLTRRLAASRFQLAELIIRIGIEAREHPLFERSALDPTGVRTAELWLETPLVIDPTRGALVVVPTSVEPDNVSRALKHRRRVDAALRQRSCDPFEDGRLAVIVCAFGHATSHAAFRPHPEVRAINADSNIEPPLCDAFHEIFPTPAPSYVIRRACVRAAYWAERVRDEAELVEACAEFDSASA